MKNQDTKPTLMIFKILEGEVLALMPNEIADSSGNIQSYMRVGQHSAASPELVNELKDATKQERADLVKELTSIGYLVKEGN